MTIGSCAALVELLNDFARWVEAHRPDSLDVALVRATRDLAVAEALQIAAQLER